MADIPTFPVLCFCMLSWTTQPMLCVLKFSQSFNVLMKDWTDVQLQNALLYHTATLGRVSKQEHRL